MSHCLRYCVDSIMGFQMASFTMDYVVSLKVKPREGFGQLRRILLTVQFENL